MNLTNIYFETMVICKAFYLMAKSIKMLQNNEKLFQRNLVRVNRP